MFSKEENIGRVFVGRIISSSLQTWVIYLLLYLVKALSKWDSFTHVFFSQGKREGSNSTRFLRQFILQDFILNFFTRTLLNSKTNKIIAITCLLLFVIFVYCFWVKKMQKNYMSMCWE